MTQYGYHYVSTLYGLLTLITHHTGKSLVNSNFVNLQFTAAFHVGLEKKVNSNTIS